MAMRGTRSPFAAHAIAALVVMTAACATNPATGKKEISLMSEAQEVQLGQEMDAQVKAKMGVYNDPELQRYVSEIGMRLARGSERPNLPWHFTVVDEPAVNAFALPGGQIYITRGILAFLKDEEQLAGVLGHEIGHVTARHSAQQYTKATGAGLGLTLLSIFVPEARPLQGAAESALSVLFLKYGRDDELQSDRLGAQYTARAGWNPAGVAGMLTTLQRLDEASGDRRGVPNWLSTHPAPADRVQQVTRFIQENPTSVGTAGNDRPGQDFQRYIAGIIFGDSPSDGIIRGNQFLHPELRLGITFPKGWEIQNSATQVVAKAPDRDHYLILQLVPGARGNLQQIAQATMANAGFRQLQGESTSLNGLNAYVGTYQGALEGAGNVVMLAAHIVQGNSVYMFAGLAAANQFQNAQQPFASSIRSFRELSQSEAAAIHPNRVDIYTVRGGETWASIAERSGGVVKPETLAIMNNHEPSQQPRAGERIKIVVEG
ncbi:M48 family metalloprotease [soil metagenome]